MPRPRRWTVAALAGLIALCTISAGAPASGDELSDARAEAAAIAARVDALSVEIELIAEEYNAASLQLDAVRARIAAAEGEVAASQAEADERRSAVLEYAVEAYIGGGTDSTLEVLLSSLSSADLGERQGYLAAATGSQQDAIDDLVVAEEDARIQIEELAVAQAEAEALTATLASRRAEVEGREAEQRNLLASATSEVAALVAQERARVHAQQQQRAAQRQAQADAQPPAAVPVPAPATNGGAQGAVQEGLRHVGKPYQWGGSGPNSFDCSGFTSYAWRVGGGVSLPHNSRAQRSATTRIPMNQIQPGDLIFYGQPEIHHVALYIGNGQIVHAPSSGEYVRVDSIYYWDELVGAGRIG